MVRSLRFEVCGLLILLCVFSGHVLAWAQPILSSELIKNAGQYDGQAVVYQGEVIGDVMDRGSYSWINVHDGNNAIGIWLPDVLTGQIEYTGSYKARGDRVEIVGVFHRSCLQHGGDLDIHAQVLHKVASGRNIEERLNVAKKNQVIILGGLCLLVWILTVLVRK